MNKKTKLIIGLIIITAIAAIGFYFVNSKQSTEAQNIGATTLKVPNGGTGATSFSAGQCLVGNGTGAITTSACGASGGYPLYLGQIGDVSTTTLAAGYVLKYSGTEWESVATSTLGITGTGGGTPGGSDTQIQFNNAGSFGGSANMTWDEANRYLIIGNDAESGAIVGSTSVGVAALGVTNMPNIALNADGFSMGNYGGNNIYVNSLTGDPSNTIVLDGTASTTADLTVAGNLWANSFIGNLTGTASGNLTSGSIDTIAELNAILTGEDVASTSGTYANLKAGSASGVNETYGSGWNADTDAPEKDDIYDYTHLFDTDDDGNINALDTDAVDAITEIAAALKDGSGDCSSGLICLGDHTHSTYAPLASPTFTGVATLVNASTTVLTVTTGYLGTILGVIDAGSATSFEIPNNTNPTIDAAGEIAINTTAASSSIRFATGTTELALYPEKEKSLNISSTTLIYSWSGLSATSTIPIGFASRHGETWLEITGACNVTTGVDFGDGTNFMNYTNFGTATSTTILTSNNVFILRESQYIRIKPSAATYQWCVLTPVIRPNAD